MAGIALTGSASGIGAATRRRVESEGRRVIGVDLRDAEVLADLGTAAGREAAIAGLMERCDGSLEGYAGFAGVPATVEPPAQLVHVSYFGSIAMLEGLRGALTRGGPASAVAVSSCAATVAPVDDALVAACLEGDEARAAAQVGAGGVAYASVKLAFGALGPPQRPGVGGRRGPPQRVGARQHAHAADRDDPRRSRDRPADAGDPDARRTLGRTRRDRSSRALDVE